MQLGKAIIGGIIGAALGIGALITIYMLLQIDHVALAILVALLTGLGVRTLVSTSGHASYVRGALTGVLALAAYVGGWFLVAEVAKARAATAPKRPVATAPKEVKDEPKAATGEAGEAPPVQVMPQAGPRPTGAMPKAVTPGQNPLDYVWLAIAALVAYELGRGSAGKTMVVGEETATEVPMATHPDA